MEHSSDGSHENVSNGSNGTGNVRIPTSPEKMVRRLRRWHVECRAYGEIYHERSQKWGKLFYVFNLSPVVVNLLSALFGLAIIQDATKSNTIVSALAIFAASIGAMVTVLKPGQRQTHSEHAGDEFSILSDALEMVDESASVRELATLVDRVTKKVSRFKRRYQEPERKHMERHIRSIRERIQKASEEEKALWDIESQQMPQRDASEEQHVDIEPIRTSTMLDLIGM